MPVYEIVRTVPSGRSRISFTDRERVNVGDVITVDRCRWIVISKEPPFHERRIERIVLRAEPQPLAKGVGAEMDDQSTNGPPGMAF